MRTSSRYRSAQGRRLLARLALFESIVHNANDAILVTEAEPIDEPGPRIVFANESFTRMTGYTSSEVLGKTPRILQTATTDRVALDRLRAALERWQPIRVELVNRRKNGEEFWVELNIVPVADDTGHFTHWLSIQRETTARKLAEEGRFRGAERFRDSLLQNATDIAALLEPDGVVRYQNPSGARILNIRDGDTTDRNLFSRIHPDDLPHARAVFTAGLMDGAGGLPPVSVRVHDGDSSWRHLMMAFTNRMDDPGIGGVVLNAWDITAQRRADEALRLRDRAIAAANNGIIIADVMQPDMPIVYANAALERITGYSRTELIGRNARFLHGDDCDQPELDALRRALAAGRAWSGTLRNYRKDGTLFYNEMNISPVYDDEGCLRSFIGVQNDITARRALEAQLAHQAFHDALTGLPNRALFMERLAHDLLRAARDRHAIAVLFLDLDRFKIVNDSLGHAVGDHLLIAVGERLQTILRPGDTIARLGGDEFTLLLEGPVRVNDAVQVAERVLEALEEPFDVDGREIFTTASIGIALSRPGVDEPIDLLRDADVAMYRAKGRGAPRFEVFDPAMNAYAVKRLETESQLRQALDHGELVLHYQPIVALATGVAIGMEALVRWQAPGRGLVLPQEFIPLAEETGLILPIGRWVLTEACRQARLWQEANAGRAPLMMSINLSARQFAHPDLTAEIAGVLRETAIDPGAIVLEITESVMMEDPASSALTLRRLRDLGVRLAMDDFGTGYSSLGQLRRFPVDILKIDKSFVSGLGKDEEDTAIVRAVVSLGHALDMTLVAEGVETLTQLAALRLLGCAVGQGFYFAGGLPADAAHAAITNATERRAPHDETALDA